ncbi:MAG TPA: FAD-dependent oxidoreductase, partial [Ktedonobacterales bacterium]
MSTNISTIEEAVPPREPVAHAPWAEEISVEARTELDLPGIEALPASEVDVAVIGAGVAGLSAALAAAQAGANVVVLEATQTIGQGATGRNAGILSAGINMGLADAPPGEAGSDMWPATTRELLALVDEASKPDAILSASLTGALSLAESPTAARGLAREARARVALGLRAEIWTPAQVAEATDGRLNVNGVVAALWLPDEGRIQPLTLLAHLARQARAAGVSLMGGALVRANEPQRRGGVTRWKLTIGERESIIARRVIVAVGPTAQPTARIYALALPAELPATFPLFWDAAPYTYMDFRPGVEYLTASGGRYAPAEGSARDWIYHQRLADAARRWLPELAGREPSHAWAVDLAVAHDMIPRLTPLGMDATGVAIEGLGALGVLPGIVLGKRTGSDMA